MADGTSEFKAKTVEEAIGDGLRTLKLAEADVDIEVISKGSRGIFGIGSEPAHVRLTPRARSASTSATKEAVGATIPTAAEPTDSALDLAASAQPVQEAAVALDEPEPSFEVQKGTAAEEGDTLPAPDGDDTDDDTDDDDASYDPPSDDELAEIATEMLANLVNLMGFDAEVTASWQAPDQDDGPPYLVLNVEGENLGSLIGPRGEALDNVQYLLRLMVNQQMKQWQNVVVDVGHYKERRVTQLTQMAMRMAEQVEETGRSMSLEPMPPSERRIIHLALRDHPAVYTESQGEGEKRHIQILARQ